MKNTGVGGTPNFSASLSPSQRARRHRGNLFSPSVSVNSVLTPADACPDQAGALMPLPSFYFQAGLSLQIPRRILLPTDHCSLITVHSALRLTALDSSAYSPFRDPTSPSDCPDRVGV